MTEEQKTEPTYEQKVEKFIELFNNRPLDDKGKAISNAECARRAGWPANRMYKTANELLKKPDIAKRIKQVEELQRVELTNGTDSVKTILDTNIHLALKELQKDPHKFVNAYLQFQKLNKETLAEYDGFSTGELLLEVEDHIKKLTELVKLVKEANLDVTN